LNTTEIATTIDRIKTIGYSLVLFFRRGETNMGIRPQSGGQKIPPSVQARTRERILKHAMKIVPEKASQVRVWFRGHFCYIDAEEPDGKEPWHLCRLRYMGSLREPKAWSMAFSTYSREKYEPCVFESGDFLGTPEKALEIGATYLR
jgi:hypothetical protein